MYRRRLKYSKKMAALRAAKERRRLEGPAPEYPAELPDLRRIVVVIDFDFGKVVEVMRLYKTSRVDCYRAVVNGRVWRERVGWTQVLNALRRSFLRVAAA